MGRLIGNAGASRLIAAKEQELFTAQKGFKNLYEQEVAGLKSENISLKEKVGQLEQRVEEYRKKAAGFGGLFGSGGKRADAIVCLLWRFENGLRAGGRRRYHHPKKSTRNETPLQSTQSCWLHVSG